MRFSTATAQVARVGGRRYDQVSGILVEEQTSRFGRGRGRGNLYVLVQMEDGSGGNEVVAGNLAEVICDTYFAERRSVTAGLQQAIREANSLLFEQNRDALPGERLTAGVSCLLLREQDLFIAQAGPAAIYLIHDGQVIRFPELSPWLDNIPRETVDTAPLGERREVPVDLFHYQVTDNDTVLLVDSRVARQASPRIWRGILTAATVEAATEALLAVGQGGDLSALVLRIGEQPDRQAAPEAPPARAAPMAAAAASVPKESAERVEQRPGRERVRVGGRLLGAIVAAFLVLLKRMMPGPAGVAGEPAGKAAPVMPAEIPSPKTAPAAQGATPVGKRVRKSRAGVAADKTAPAEETSVAGKTALAEETKVVAGKAAPAARAAAQAGKTAPEAQPGMRAGRKTSAARVETAIRERQQEEPRIQVRAAALQKLLLAVAILIPVVVAAVVVYSLLQRGQTQKAAADDLWMKAESLVVQADATNDPAQVRSLLGAAQSSLDQLLAQQPGRTDALALQQKIQQRLDANNQVLRVPWQGRMVTYPAGTDLSRVVVEGVHVFVLDRNGDTVYHHQMDELQQAILPETQGTVLVRKGDQVGKILVGDLIDMAWMPAGNGRTKAALLILESGGSLLQYDPASKELVALHVAASDRWQLPQLMGTHSGRFYLLDPKVNQIWRYSPTSDGYSAQPEQWLKSAIDLSGIRDMAVGDSIFLLYADGTIRRLSTGEPDTFDITDWDMPPKGPTAIFTRPPAETQWLYLADPGNNRIVQSGTDGRFKRQFRLADSQQAAGDDALARVTGLFVDEIGGRAYFLSGNGLYMIILPE